MLDIPQPTIARAIAILRTGPMRADEFARRMWPERSADRTSGEQSRSGHPLLRQLAQVGYVQRVGDLWMLRTVGTAVGLDDFGVSTAAGTAVGPPVGLPVAPAVGLPVRPGDGQPEQLPDRLPNEPPRTEAERRADLERLHRLVQLATEPVDTVTHDQVLGDVAIRGQALDDCLIEAAVIVVLAGRAMNVYLPNDAPMLVGLTPIEAARALHVRWAQSGVPPELPHDEGWIFGDDGAIAAPTCWRPIGRDEELWLCGLEPLDKQIHRQRAAAGLA